MFPDSIHASADSSLTATWRMMFTHGINSVASRAIRITTKALGSQLSNTVLPNWSSPADSLFGYLGGDQTAYGCYATEYLKAGKVDFLATFDGYGIGVSRMYWQGRDFFLQVPVTTAVPSQSPRSAAQPSLRALGRTVGVSSVTFEIGLPAANRARLTLYDVTGRRVRVVLDRTLTLGRTTVEWDGRDASGSLAPSGIYFARLSGVFASRVARVPFVH